MSKNTFDAILASTPLNSTAALVTSRGQQYESVKRISQLHWEAPTKMRPPTDMEAAASSFEDLKGRKFGRFTVLGILDREKTGNGTPNVWVVKCVCGDYESRRARSIRNPANAEDRCEKCRQLSYLQRTETQKARGLLPPNTVDSFQQRQASK